LRTKHIQTPKAQNKSDVQEKWPLLSNYYKISQR